MMGWTINVGHPRAPVIMLVFGGLMGAAFLSQLLSQIPTARKLPFPQTKTASLSEGRLMGFRETKAYAALVRDRRGWKNSA